MLLPNCAPILGYITLEPVILLYAASLTLNSLTGQNLLLQKVCHPGAYGPPTAALCDNEQAAQERVTQIQTWKHVITFLGPVIFVVFAGPWSDNHGKRRKPLMYLPLVGQILADLLCILNVYFWSWSPVITALSESVLPATTGWRSCFLVGVNCYISDITPKESRTTYYGLCTALYFIGMPIGAFVFGFFFHRIGFYGNFSLCVVLNIAALIYLILFVTEGEFEKNIHKLKVCENLVDIRYVVQSLRTVYKHRIGNKRAVVLLIICVAPISLAALQGEYAILYFYLRYQFHWNEVDYGFYAGYKTIIIFVGTLITMGIFSRLLRISDAVIGMMSCVTLMIASVGYTFASMTWQLYVFPIVDFMHGAGLAVVFSIVSKTIESNELGQVNSIIGVADAVFPLINLPLYTQVYNHTFTQLPGAFFILSFIYGVTALIIFGVVYVLQRMPVSEEVPNEKTKL